MGPKTHTRARALCAIGIEGVEEPADLLELEDEDYAFMKKLHRKKYLNDALAQLRADPPGYNEGSSNDAGDAAGENKDEL